MTARVFWLIALTVFGFVGLATLLPADDTGSALHAQQVRDTREQFNLAIEHQNIEAIGDFLAPSYQMVTGRSELAHSKAEAVEVWRSTFRDDPTYVCRRVPDDISVNANWGMAQETGHWACKYHIDGEPVHYTGVYGAKWQRTARAVWLLQSELFTTLTCEGPEAGCRPPDPLE